MITISKLVIVLQAYSRPRFSSYGDTALNNFILKMVNVLHWVKIILLMTVMILIRLTYHQSLPPVALSGL